MTDAIAVVAIGIAFLEVALVATTKALVGAAVVPGVTHLTIFCADVIAASILLGEVRQIVTLRWRLLGLLLLWWGVLALLLWGIRILALLLWLLLVSWWHVSAGLSLLVALALILT